MIKKFLPQISYIRTLFKETKNPIGAKNPERLRWAKDLQIPKHGERILFVGCLYPNLKRIERMMDYSIKFGAERSASLALILNKIKLNVILNVLIYANENESNERLKRIALSLKKLGVDFAYLGNDEPCCGEILYNLGFHEQFKQHATKVMQQLKNMGVKEMIVLSPFCAYTLKEIYKQVNPEWNVKVKTLAEILAENVDKYNLSLSKNVSVVYHDPCYYARHLNIVNEPRKVLKSIRGINLKEPEYKGINTRCVGDGGLELTYPKLANDIASDRVKELINTNADVIVTQCPTCMVMIKKGLKSLNVEKKILDLGEIVYESVVEKKSDDRS